MSDRRWSGIRSSDRVAGVDGDADAQVELRSPLLMNVGYRPLTFMTIQLPEPSLTAAMGCAELNVEVPA